MKQTILALLACGLLCACGSAPAAPAGDTPAPAEGAAIQTPVPEAEPDPAVTAAEGVSPDYGPLYFDYRGLRFGIFDEARPILEALGAPADTFTADSCAYQGSDYYYYYDGIELCVNEVEGVERVTGITLADDTVQTPQGFCIGMDVAGLDGAGILFSRSGSVYSFTHGSTLLRVRDGGDGTVAAIAYMPAQ